MADNFTKFPVSVVVPAEVFDAIHERMHRSGLASRFTEKDGQRFLDVSELTLIRAHPGIKRIGSDDPLDGVSEEFAANDRKAANARQIGGEHYGLGSMQHWDIVAMFGLDYFQGNITKYVFRWRKKGGVEDLKKAQHYLEKYIEVVTTGAEKGT